MHILHGTWIPREDAGFRQSGRFCLWVETTNPRGSKPLPATQLATLLTEDLGLARDAAQLRRMLGNCHLLLPEADGEPLPSLELARLAGLPLPETDSPLDLSSHEVSCYVPDQVLATLKDLEFICRYRLTQVHAGTDLLFWCRFGRELARVIIREQYIPALKCRTLEESTGKRRKKAAPFEIHPGWEIVSEDYQQAVQQASGIMPGLCAAGAEQPHGDTQGGLYEAESLLRHFAECQLDAHIHSTRLPVTFQKRFTDTLLEECLSSRRDDLPLRSERWQEHYRQWQQWQQALTHGQGDTGLQLCLQLYEAGETAQDWYLEFQVSPRNDPSLRPPLDEYWRDSSLRKLLQRQLGEDPQKHILLALGYAARIYSRLWDGLNDARPKGLSLSLEEAFEFLKEHAPVLQDAGMRVLVPAWWTPEGRQRATMRLRLSGQQQSSGSTTAAGPGYFSMDSLLRYRYELAIDGEPVSAQEWAQLVEAKTPLVRFRGQWLELDPQRMQQMLSFWEQHGQGEAEISLGDLLRRSAEGEEELDISRDAQLTAMLEALRDPATLKPVENPPGLQGKLRPYQQRGVAWLGFLEQLGMGACLADDMGLGKTLQVLARLLEAGPAEAPTLLIAPTSVLGNWQREAQRFAPALAVLIHHGGDRLNDRKDFQEACRGQQLVVTSYSLARRDAALLQAVSWQRVVLDEAQNIKNPAAAQTKAILKLKAGQRLALTGTPVENRLMDLWSIFNFLNPGYLGTQARFRKGFELPVQRDRDPLKTEVLKKLVQPFILRRVKTDRDIIQDLPDKVENRQYCNLTREQASLYDAVVQEVEREIDSAEGIQRRGLILATLMRLKQVCNHPAQFLRDNSAFTPERSHKLERLLEMLEQVVEAGESLLIFTQFTEIGKALEKLLRPRCRTFYLHGGTSRKQREQMIEAFQDPESPASAFVLSLKAGGTGITLTRANHVFHFDRWWNPAVEDQATDRAYRIGQARNVFVHKFVTLGTLEERIDRMIEDKKAVAGSIVGNDESWLSELDNEHFKALIRLNRDAVLE